MRYCDEQQPAFSLMTKKPLADPSEMARAIERERIIRELSVKNYTPKPRQAVMDWLKKRYPKVRQGPVYFDTPSSDGGSMTSSNL